VWVAPSLAAKKMIIDVAATERIQIQDTTESQERLLGRFAPPASLTKEITGYRRATLERMQMQKAYYEILGSEKTNTPVNVRSQLCP